jgi:hypothetical protein
MALINCGECGREISTKAKSCPHCGAPLAPFGIDREKVRRAADGFSRLFDAWICWAGNKIGKAFLQKAYRPILTGITILFGVSVIPVLGFVIYVKAYLFVPGVAGAVVRLITAREYHLPGFIRNISITALALLGTLPIIGWFCRLAALMLAVSLLYAGDGEPMSKNH